MFGSLARKLFGSKATSNSVAKSRLHFVLVQDRAGLTPEEMGKFRKELSEVIERYFVIDTGKFDIAYERSDDVTTLVINSPVVAKRVTDGRTNAKLSDKKQGSARGAAPKTGTAKAAALTSHGKGRVAGTTQPAATPGDSTAKDLGK